jgi:hypothetical protein
MALKSISPYKFTNKDYLGSEQHSLELCAQIRAYWAKLNKSPKVWVEKEKLVTSPDARPTFRYVVRSNLKLSI